MNEYMHDWPENKIIFHTGSLEISCLDDRMTVKINVYKYFSQCQNSIEYVRYNLANVFVLSYAYIVYYDLHMIFLIQLMKYTFANGLCM